MARLALVMALLSCGGCGERPREIYEQGLAIEQAANKGACRIVASEGMIASLSGNQIAACLQQTEQALELYDRAAQRGLDAIDFVRVHERARERQQRLTDMLTQVRRMERDQ